MARMATLSWRPPCTGGAHLDACSSSGRQTPIMVLTPRVERMQIERVHEAQIQAVPARRSACST